MKGKELQLLFIRSSGLLLYLLMDAAIVEFGLFIFAIITKPKFDGGSALIREEKVTLENDPVL